MKTTLKLIKSFLIVLMALWSLSARSQNLVANPGFEDYYDCPWTTTQINECKGVFNPVDFIASPSTSDYFNSCAPSSSIATVPLNSFGYQMPFEGNGYIGLGVYSSGFTEAAQIKLSQSLETGKRYKFTFYVSLTNVFTILQSFDGFSLKFCNDSIIYPDGYLFNYFNVDWRNSAYNFLTDTLKWMKLSGIYEAKGGEQWVIIGGLLPPSEMHFDPDLATGGAAYYYIDGFSVEEFRLPNVFTPNGDGINDVFYIEGLNADDRILIFNRWGLKITEFKGDEGWDAENVSDGTYYCIIRSGLNIIKKGFVSILR